MLIGMTTGRTSRAARTLAAELAVCSDGRTAEQIARQIEDLTSLELAPDLPSLRKPGTMIPDRVREYYAEVMSLDVARSRGASVCVLPIMAFRGYDDLISRGAFYRDMLKLVQHRLVAEHASDDERRESVRRKAQQVRRQRSSARHTALQRLQTLTPMHLDERSLETSMALIVAENAERLADGETIENGEEMVGAFYNSDPSYWQSLASTSGNPAPIRSLVDFATRIEQVDLHMMQGAIGAFEELGLSMTQIAEAARIVYPLIVGFRFFRSTFTREDIEVQCMLGACFLLDEIGWKELHYLDRFTKASRRRNPNLRPVVPGLKNHP
jgi:hypothetical protein